MKNKSIIMIFALLSNNLFADKCESYLEHYDHFDVASAIHSIVLGQGSEEHENDHLEDLTEVGDAEDIISFLIDFADFTHSKMCIVKKPGKFGNIVNKEIYIREYHQLVGGEVTSSMNRRPKLILILNSNASTCGTFFRVKADPIQKEIKQGAIDVKCYQNGQITFNFAA